MQNSIQVGRRRFIWVKEQPGPILILFIALVMMFSLHFLVKAEPAPALTDVEEHDLR